MPIYGANKKVSLTNEEIKFVKDNFFKMTNPQLAEHLGLKLTTFRTIVYRDLNLKRMEMEYWNNDMICFLKENYKTIGDVEIAEIFQIQFPKNKKWSKKHIEKKRRYLNLKRTKEEIANIIKRNASQGRLNTVRKSWRKRECRELFSIVKWKLSSGYSSFYIKSQHGYMSYKRYLWNEAFGEIPIGYNVIDKRIVRDDLPTINDLECISNAELAKRNKTKFHLLPQDLQEVISLKNKIQKTLKNEYKS